QGAFEGGHPAAAVGHLFFGAGLSFGQRHGPQVRTAVATVAGGAVADGAFFGEHFFARRRVGSGAAGTGFSRRFFTFGFGAAFFFAFFARPTGFFIAGVERAFGFLFGACLRAHRAFQREDPEIFTVRGGRQRVAAGVDRDLLFAFVFERGDRRVGAGPGLEAPEFFAVFDVERLEFAVVLADEHEAARGRDRARVTRFGEFVLPGDFPGGHVVRRQEARRGEPAEGGKFATLVGFPFVVLRLVGFGDHAERAFQRADEVHVFFRVIRG